LTRKPQSAPPGPGLLSARFRNINIILFGLAFCVMAAVMASAFNKVIKKVSSDYAASYALGAANALSAHIVKELGLMAKAAHSKEVVEWLADEEDQDKKLRAYEEMSGVVGELYSYNLYVGVENSHHEYNVEDKYEADNIVPFITLDEKKPEDAWYFGCVNSKSDYQLDVAVDNVQQKNRVWLDYKVVQKGVTLGVLCTGLDFTNVAAELFSQYDKNEMRGFIIDENGIIHIDSSFVVDGKVTFNEFEAEIAKKLSDPEFLAEVNSHPRDKDGYFLATGHPVVMEMPTGPYRYMTVAPIRFTNWSAVILSDFSSLLNMSLFMPVFLTMLGLLIIFSLAVNAASSSLIFAPLGKLEHSLTRLTENSQERVYGLDRRDELGNLANTIMDLFTKANHDALTGLNNRRFMEDNFPKLMDLLSRAGGLLSVIMLDVDFFKKYNDAYGHEEGDACLRAVARTLADCLTRSNDFAARYGGEEFVAVLPNTDEAGARLLAEELLRRVRALNLPHSESQASPYLTVSIGVTTGQVVYPQTWEAYLKRADEALYLSKQNGRNQYTFLAFT